MAPNDWSGFATDSAAWEVPWSRVDNAHAPIPQALPRKKARRVRAVLNGSSRSMGLTFGNGFVEIQKRAADQSPRGQFARVKIDWRHRRAHMDEPRGSNAVVFKR